MMEWNRKSAGTSLEGFRLLLDGTTNWAAVMEALEQTGYRGCLTFEYFRPLTRYPDALIYPDIGRTRSPAGKRVSCCGTGRHMPAIWFNAPGKKKRPSREFLNIWRILKSLLLALVMLEKAPSSSRAPSSSKTGQGQGAPAFSLVVGCRLPLSI
jgi:hypothetical protein